jgi:hypothetical protein
MLVKLAVYLGRSLFKRGAAYKYTWLLLLSMLVKLAVYLGSLCSKEGLLTNIPGP